jgi:hypothetical protein
MSEQGDKQQEEGISLDPNEDIKAPESNLTKAQKNHANAANKIGYQLEIVKAIPLQNSKSIQQAPSWKTGSGLLNSFMLRLMH